MKNVFYVVLSIAVLLIAGSITYYIMGDISKQSEFEIKEKCNNACSKILESEKEELDIDPLWEYMTDPDYVYNSELNTCLFYNVKTNTASTYGRVIDCFTNDTVDSYLYMFGGNTGQMDAFDLRKEKLWNNQRADRY